MANIIDHVTCDACNGEGEIKNEGFLTLDPQKRLEMAYEEGFDPITQDMSKPMIKCPFCEDGEAPVYECDECDGTGDNKADQEHLGCPKCEGQGWYL